MYPKVYVILLNYNGWVDTIECLESVLRNDYPNYQVIVVDNNSPNNSIEYIEAWAEGKLNVWTKPKNPLRHLSHPPLPKPIPYVYYTKEEAEKGGNLELENLLMNQIPEGITTKYPIVFIQTGKNGGFAFGNNVGIRYALAKDDFDSIILLNNDTVIEKKAILELYKAKEQYGNKAIYGGRIYYYSDVDKIWYDGGYLNEWLGRAIHINIDRKNIPFKSIHKVNFITFCYVAIPREIIKEFGLLNESYFMYAEDLDYSYRLWKSGYILYHVSSSQIWHKVGASSGDEVTPFSAYWYYRNSLKFRIEDLRGIKKTVAIYFYFFRIPFLILKWSIKNKKIVKSLLNGVRDECFKTRV